MGGIGVIINPHARGNTRRPRRVARFKSIVGADGDVVALALAALLLALVLDQAGVLRGSQNLAAPVDAGPDVAAPPEASDREGSR